MGQTKARLAAVLLELILVHMSMFLGRIFDKQRHILRQRLGASLDRSVQILLRGPS